MKSKNKTKFAATTFLVFILIVLFLLTGCKKQEEKENSQPTPNLIELLENPDVIELLRNGKPTILPTPTAQKLPVSWRGFNLTNIIEGYPFEDDFKMMSEFGFNFVRVMINYKMLINEYYKHYEISYSKEDFKNMIIKNKINADSVGLVDKAVELGIKYDIHVSLVFHTAPGWTVDGNRQEPTNLWVDNEPQELFTQFWEYLAERYKNIPNEYLSFNLVNEPPDIEESVYAALMKKVADAIWSKNPNRLIIADGLDTGRKPSYLIKELGMAQATRGYYPHFVTHYMHPEGASHYLVRPTWPAVYVPKILYSLADWHGDAPRSIYSIEHDFNEKYNLDVNVGIVSYNARLIAKADNLIIFNRWFDAEGEQVFNKDYRIEIPAGTKLVTLEVTDGNWLTIDDMKFTSVSGNGLAFSITPNIPDWGIQIPPVKVSATGEFDYGGVGTKAWLYDTYFKEWKELVDSGGGAMVGEWGVFFYTPHDVALKWMEDNLQIYKECGMGWALYSFFNSEFGIFSAKRTDITHETYNGRRLDRKMLELLQRY